MRDLRDMLGEKTVLLNQTVSDWKEAVRIGGNMLVDVQRLLNPNMWMP